MRRTTTIIGVAALAPVLVFAAMVGAESFRDRARQTEMAHLANAREVNAQVDGELMAHASALSVFASSAAVVSGDWAAARERALELMTSRPSWRVVALTDVRTRRELWSTDRELGPPRPVRPQIAARLGAPGAVGDMGGREPGCPCLSVSWPIADGSAPRYLLTVVLSVEGLQRILDSEVKAPEVGALVDRRGNFIARTLMARERLGRPASTYVRATLGGPKSGVYDGVTLEGLRNRSVYETSTISGFSTHIALARNPFSLLGAGSLGLTLLALTLGLIVATLGALYVVRDQQRWRDEERGRVNAQKLEAIGRFASSVAHDFNNLLTVIIGNLDRLERRVSDPRDRRAVEHARAAAAQGAALVGQLLSFARQKPVALERVDLRDLLLRLEPLLRESVPQSVAVSAQLPPGDHVVQTNEAQLSAALVNLARNAGDAMPNGGRLSFDARPVAQGAWVDLMVSDTGHGMPPDVVARALDPFYTTKAAGKGTGLGLAQVQALMLQSGGKIEVASKVGEGSTITLRFPAARPQA